MSLAIEVWNELASRYSSDLRAVIRYHPTDFDGELREDISEQYSERELERIVDKIIIDQLSIDDFASDFHLGNMESTVRTFEEAWVLIYPDGLNEKSGFIVSFERNSASSSIVAVEETSEYLSDQILPQLL